MFQSSPAARGGRNFGSDIFGAVGQRFNPRPLHAAGATANDLQVAGAGEVSILARCTRRAQRGTRCWCARVWRFNPRPLHAAGATRCRAKNAGTRACFNPRPLHAAGATTLDFTAACPMRCFNPRPLHAAGATSAAGRAPCGRSRFNPRPLHAAGATFERAGPAWHARVSILARCTRRAQPGMDTVHQAIHAFQSSPAARGGRNLGFVAGDGRLNRFNPRPLHAAGATPARHLRQGCRRVSILARCTRRAQPPARHLRQGCQRVSILARCTRRAQPDQAGAWLKDCLFQSSPAARGGRNRCGHSPVSAPSCFNPRPLHAAGATSPNCDAWRPYRVSILARCTRRAQPHVCMHCVASELFQSSPAARGGRNPATATPQHEDIMFQSSPAARGGRNHHASPKHIGRYVFQSSPAARGGRNTGCYPCAASSRMFQSSPAARGGRNSSWTRSTAARSRFNPRPLHAAGATLTQ